MLALFLNALGQFVGGIAFGAGMVLPSYYMGRRWGRGCKDGQA